MRINYFWQPSSTLSIVLLSLCICFISCGLFSGRWELWVPAVIAQLWAAAQLQHPTPIQSPAEAAAASHQHLQTWKTQYLTRWRSLTSLTAISLLLQLPLLLVKLMLIFAIVIYLFIYLVSYVFSGKDSFHIIDKKFCLCICSNVSSDSSSTSLSLSFSIQ